MGKIAVVTLYDDINIGNKLQNYAVQELCKRRNFKTITMTYNEKLQEITWKGYMAAILGFPKKKADIKRLQINRKKNFKRFSKIYLSVSRPMSFTDYNEQINNKYDAFIVGSDQVWHNWTSTKEELDYFFLRFAEQKKRLCIAPSFGLENIPEEFKKQYVEGLSGFNYLSCREKSGCNLIEGLIGKKVEHIIDPTMMFTSNEWAKIEKKPEYFIPNRYMMVYFLGGMEEDIKIKINNIAQEMQLEIIDIFNLDYPHYYSTAPDEFLYVLKHAEIIFTNSFHGCVFSILYHKPFVILERTDIEGRKMKSRLKMLLEIFKLNIYDNINGNYYKEIDFKYIDTVLEKERKKETEYLNLIFNSIKL